MLPGVALAGLVIGGIGGWWGLYGVIFHNPTAMKAGGIVFVIGLVVYFGLQPPRADDDPSN